jgi:CheY-like chemotaxis protein
MVAGFRGLRVLVLAGGNHARTILGRAVRSILATAEVIEAADADAAETAFGRDPDLAVIDLDDADAGGLLALRLAKTSVGRPMPVIAAARDEDTRARARELGADEVLNAPPSIPDLQAAIVRAMGRPLRVG